MFTLKFILIAAIVWQVVGGLYWLIVMMKGKGACSCCHGVEFVNPVWIYNHYKVNYFGCAMMTILYNIVCPVLSFGYWFYKLCVVGRK